MLRTKIFGSARTEEIQKAEGLVCVPPFDDPRIVAGQGTIGMEILEDCPEVDLVLCGVGGGGLISGIALGVRLVRSAASVVGIEPEGAPTLWTSYKEGKPARLASVKTIADGLSAPWTGELNYRICRRLVEEVILMSDEEIRSAVRVLADRARVVAEPAGAAAFAAILAKKIPIAPQQKVVCIVSGGNMGLDRLKTFL